MMSNDLCSNRKQFSNEKINSYLRVGNALDSQSTGSVSKSVKHTEPGREAEVISNLIETSTCPKKAQKRKRSISSSSTYRQTKRERLRSKSGSNNIRDSSCHKKRNRVSKSKEKKFHRQQKHSRKNSHANHRRSSRSRSRNRRKEYSKSTSRHEKSPLKREKFYEERRKVREKSRSNSALRVMKMKNLENACGYYQRYYQRPHEDNDPKKPQLYWDGYQWVIRPTSLASQNFDVIKPGRKVQISNVPLHLNIQVNMFKEYLIKNTLERNVISRKDANDPNDIIRAIVLDTENNTAILVLESTDIAKRMVLLDGLILLGHTLRFSAYKDIDTSEVSCSNISKAAALANSAHLSAKSAAISYAAFQSLFNKGENVQLNFSTGEQKVAVASSKILKVMNLVDPEEIPKMKPEDFEEKLEDIKEEFEKFGNIVSTLVIKPKNEKIGAEASSVFIEFQEVRAAESCIKGMKGRQYEGRELKIAFIDENVFKNEIM